MRLRENLICALASSLASCVKANTKLWTMALCSCNEYKAHDTRLS